MLAEKNGNYKICSLHMINSVRTERSLNYSHQDNLQPVLLFVAVLSRLALSSGHHSCQFVLSLRPPALASQWLLPKASISSAPREPTASPTSHWQSHLSPQAIRMLAIHGHTLSLASILSHMTSQIPQFSGFLTTAMKRHVIILTPPTTAL